MKLKMMIAASLAAFTLVAASSYISIVDAYKAKDWNYVVAQTTNGFKIVQFKDIAYTKLNLTANDVIDLADLMAQAGKNKAAIELYKFAKNDDKALLPTKALIINNLIAEHGKIFLPMFTHTYLQSKDVQLFKAYVQKISTTFSTLDDSALKVQGLIYAANMIVHWNALHPEEQIQELPFTDDFVAKLAKTEKVSYVILSGDYNVSYRLTKTYYDNCMFKPETLDKFILATRYRFKDFPVDINYFAENAFDRTTDCKYRTMFALKMNDGDKLLIALKGMTPETFSASDIGKILKMFNGLPVDWHADDVLKALKNINSMYTINLYDDRDSWEPIISKIRAMIEVRQ